MAFSSGARINTNITAYNILNALNNVNNQLGVHQLRLASGKRINSAADDPSGYVISKKMEGQTGALSMALDNVGDAQSVYGVAEGGYQSIADLLTQIKEQQARFSDGAMGTDEKNAIASEIDQFATEIDDIVSQTKFNGTALLDGTYTADFQVGELATETMNVAFAAKVDSTSLLGTKGGAITAANVAGLTVDTAIQTVDAEIGKIGGADNRLTTKAANLNTAITNTDAAQSQIQDADVAQEQIQVTKLQFLQQAGTAELTQANSTPGVFLNLLK